MLRIVRPSHVADIDRNANGFSPTSMAQRASHVGATRSLVVAFANGVEALDSDSRGAVRLTAIPELSANDGYLLLDDDPDGWLRAFRSRDLEAVRRMFSRAFIVRGTVRISPFGAELRVEDGERFGAWIEALEDGLAGRLSSPTDELDRVPSLRAAFPCGLVHPRWRGALLDGRPFVDFVDDSDDLEDGDVLGRAVWVDRNTRGELSLRLAIAVDQDSATAVLSSACW